MSLARNQRNVIDRITTDRIAALRKRAVMSPDSYDKVNARFHDLPNSSVNFF